MKAWGLVLLFLCQLSYATDSVVTKKIESKPADTGLHIGFGGAYSFNGLMKFDPVNVYDSTIDEETTAEWNFKNSGAVEVEIRYLNPYSFGFIAGATFDEQRRMANAKFTGTTKYWVFYPMIDVNIKITTYYVSAAYRSEEFYFPFGINYASVQMNSPTEGFEDMKTSPGDIGWQFGVGYYMTEDIVFELISRKVSYKLAIDYPDGTPSISFGKGGFTSVSLAAKYIF